MIVDKIKRKQAVETIEKNASTEALTILASLITKPGASEKLVAYEDMITSVI